jgi:hypothetical protein
MAWLRTGILNVKRYVKKIEVIPVTGHGGTWGSETSRLPYFLENWLADGSEVVRITRRSHFPPKDDINSVRG